MSIIYSDQVELSHIVVNNTGNVVSSCEWSTQDDPEAKC